MPAQPQSPRTLIDDLLAEQQTLTAVERFARKHERHGLPAQARYYRDLIPLTKPAQGEQYAFAVDLDICTGCKACVSACHSLNGLDDDEIWRNIGLIHGGTAEEPYQQIVTTACHHCAEPACLEGCPVKAYEKEEETGIVRHLDDQCIGCQYCVLKCPYDVPKYSKKRGIVRKCDMCHDRLGAGEAPACVQSCPSGAIAIRIVNKAELIAATMPGDALLPGAYDSTYTKPATTYTTRRKMPANAQPGDSTALRLEHAHWPLILMLVFTQIAAGMYMGVALLGLCSPHGFTVTQAPVAVAAFVILNIGLAVSVLHLGRPLGAWRAFLGLRTSWMSREIFAFSIFAAPAAAFMGAALWNVATGLIPKLRLLERFINPSHFTEPLAVATALLGVLGVICSAMIYIDTRRIYWRGGLTFVKFFGTAVLLGAAGISMVIAWTGFFTGGDMQYPARVFMLAALVFRVALFARESAGFRQALLNPRDLDHRSSLTIWKLRRPLITALCALFAGSLFFGMLAITGTGVAVSSALFFLLTLGSQIIERYFFFTAVVAYRMPGPLDSGQSSHA
ncbi:MAG: DmsC/YnfH family molybdoenzyme membrane anchor subunit [Chthoniobacteraceae bacterium]